MIKKIFLCIVMFLPSFCYSQQVISFNTTYYGNEFPYSELYISNDAVFLEDYKQNKLKYTSEMFALPGRQKFLLVDNDVFILISDFLLRKNENIEPGDFGKPFSEIYYVAFFDNTLKKRQIISAFGQNGAEAIAFFQELKKFLERQEVVSISTVSSELNAILAHLKN